MDAKRRFHRVAPVSMTQVSAAQDGIQKLLAAEQEAQQIVSKARKGSLVPRAV